MKKLACFVVCAIVVFSTSAYAQTRYRYTPTPPPAAVPVMVQDIYRGTVSYPVWVWTVQTPNPNPVQILLDSRGGISTSIEIIPGLTMDLLSDDD